MTKLTNLQHRAIKTIERFLVDRALYGNNELKAGYVEELDGGRLMYYVTVGSAMDEGTMAEICCRDTWQLFISRRGEISSYCESRSTSYKGTVRNTGYEALIFGRRS